MKKLISLVISGLFVGMIAAMIGNLLHTSRSLTSNTLSKKRWPSSGASAAVNQWQGKHQRLIEVSIAPIGGVPDSDEKDLVLRGQIRGLQPLMGEVHYDWILPPGAAVVAGELSESVANLPDPEKFLESEITIQGVSHEDSSPKIVVLQVYTIIDGVKIGNSAVFSTKPEAVRVSTGASEKVQGLSVLPRHIQQ